MPLIVVYNPVCGDGTAKAFFHDHVFPLLERHGKKIHQIVETEYHGHAGKAIADILLDASDLVVTVVIGSGDGTLHEIINKLASVSTSSPAHSLPRTNFVLVPCGTANALFYSLFPPPDRDDQTLSNPTYRSRSLDAFLTVGQTVPLTLAIANLSGPPASRERPSTTISTVVASTSLHAAILHDSELLRSEYPGIERFKVAARKNSLKWYSASAKLLPISEVGVVQIYDPSSQAFIDHPESTTDDPIVDIEGPFTYFLSTVNVDRLESAFRIAPLTRAIPATKASLDLVIVRPLRDPALNNQDTSEARSAFVPKIWATLGGAYEDGAHVSLLYDDNGVILQSGDGIPVVEYVRCGGWEWIPDNLDKDAHFFCSDGDILEINEGGRVVCIAATPQEQAGFAVYV